ncbi:MAG: nuclear transport factor 2 family protein [Candidatus Krumholzibacteriota bacterium]|nr:nuclear transport factor 2 family protein [Candidatus Krumholzibacteriota bacterium]
MLAREELERITEEWLKAWTRHDLDEVIGLFAEEVVFESWTGIRVVGKENLRRAWREWFSNHGGFRFIKEDLLVDEKQQKVLFRWRFEGPSLEKGGEGKFERRRGVDLLHFRGGRIAEKLTYSKTQVEIEGRRIQLLLPPAGGRSWRRGGDSFPG